ncbi:phosphoinositide 3-kinase adapter protein 1-like isoform X2 [Liolophura sinensis]|uniref:phosphoinositide 3-kinase adapter protein 1-like isoform X2 n=1 Tax=Liolophura sinensis TaxID=3198878 RepID=UPI0031599051
MAMLPTFQVYPESICMDKNECLLLISEPVQEKDVCVSLQIMGQQATKIELVVKDSRTFLISIPEDFLKHEKIMVYVQYQDTLIGCERLCVEKPCEQLARLLEKTLDPVQLMISALGLKCGSEVDLNLLDLDLANVVTKNIPADQLAVLFKSYDKATPTSAEIPSKDRFPTALHFAAHYGFTKLTETLMYCYGAKAALMVVNSEGQTPRDIAANKGHQQILKLMDKKATEHDEYYESVPDVLGEEKTEDVQGTYMDMQSVRSDDNRWSVLGQVTTGPRLPSKPPPQRPRTNSIGPLQSIQEVEPSPELRDSGVFEGTRDSNISTDSHASGDSLPPVGFANGPSSPPDLPKPSKLKRTPPVTIHRKDVISDPQDNGPPSIGHRPTKRPSLPNISLTEAPFSPDEGPPPCTGPVYQNQRPGSGRKLSLPVPRVMAELHNNQRFQMRKNFVPM